MKIKTVALKETGISIETDHSPIEYHIERPGKCLVQYHNYQTQETQQVTGENAQVLLNKTITKITEQKGKRENSYLQVLDILIDEQDNDNKHFGIKITLSCEYPVHPNIFKFAPDTTRILDISIEKDKGKGKDNVDQGTVAFKLETNEGTVSLETNVHLFNGGGSYVYMKSENEPRYTRVFRFEDGFMVIHPEWEARWKEILTNSKIINVTRINVPIVETNGYTYDCIRIDCESADYLPFTIELATGYFQPRLHIEYTKLNTNFIIAVNVVRTV